MELQAKMQYARGNQIKFSPLAYDSGLFAFQGLPSHTTAAFRNKVFLCKVEYIFWIIIFYYRDTRTTNVSAWHVLVHSGGVFRKKVLSCKSLFFVQEHGKVISRVKGYQNTTIHSTVHSFTTTCKKQDKGSTELKRKQRNSLLWNMPPLINQYQFRACSKGLQTYKSMTV